MARQQLARAAQLANEWFIAIKMEDTPHQRTVLGELIDAVVPVRCSLGEYEARISWSPFARTYLGAGVLDTPGLPPE